MRKAAYNIIGLILILVMSLCILTACNKENYNDYFISPSGKIYSPSDSIFDVGFGTNNNGQEKNTPEMDRLTSVVPNDRQLDYLELEYYNFIHFGMNTYMMAEWGTGLELPTWFRCKSVDTDQWCSVLKESGSKGIIFTAKHHDGFCLWQTNTTEHSIKNSKYKNGKGDIVKELSDSCKKYGLKFGVYLSPWDRHEKTYGTEAYNDYFKAQLRELLDGRYGEIFSVWWDGALGKSAKKKNFQYDWEGYEQIVRELQPNAVTVIEGRDVRWVGNEAGISRNNEWSVISDGAEASLEFQETTGGASKLQKVDPSNEDLGSRDLLKNYKNLIFKPAEVDVSIHKGWFYHPCQKPKELDHLMKIYNRAVGGNSSLLLNVCPSKKGIIEDRDVVRLKEFGEAIRAQYKNPVEIKDVTIGGKTNRRTLNDTEMNNLLNEERYTNYAFFEDEYIVDLNFKEMVKISRIDIREDLRFSHRVELFDVYIKNGDNWELLKNAGNIGNRRSICVNPGVDFKTDAIRIVIKQARKAPVLRSICVYA